MDAYFFIKTLHIISATVLFGTGAGIAFFFWKARNSDEDVVRYFAAQTTVTADFVFTLPAVVVQPLSGFWLVWKSGVQWDDKWLITSYLLFGVAGLCWIPVVGLQIAMRNMLAAKKSGGVFDEAKFTRCLNMWFALGWPAFCGLVIVFFLMVAKPKW